MVGPLDSISSLLQSAVLHSQLQSAQREAEISNDRRRRRTESARQREQRAIVLDNPVEGRIIEADTPLRERISADNSPGKRRQPQSEENTDPGRIDVLV